MFRRIGELGFILDEETFIFKNLFQFFLGLGIFGSLNDKAVVIHGHGSKFRVVTFLADQIALNLVDNIFDKPVVDVFFILFLIAEVKADFCVQSLIVLLGRDAFSLQHIGEDDAHAAETVTATIFGHRVIGLGTVGNACKQGAFSQIQLPGILVEIGFGSGLNTAEIVGHGDKIQVKLHNRVFRAVFFQLDGVVPFLNFALSGAFILSGNHTHDLLRNRGAAVRRVAAGHNKAHESGENSLAVDPGVGLEAFVFNRNKSVVNIAVLNLGEGHKFRGGAAAFQRVNDIAVHIENFRALAAQKTVDV